MLDTFELIAKLPTSHYINGEWTGGEGTLDVINPATGKPITQVADASAEVAMSALDAAVAAQDEWAATDPRVRGELLRAAYDRIIERADDFATVMTMEMGKVLAESRGEVTYGAEFFRWFAEEAVRVHGRYGVAPSGGNRIITMKQPVGPALAITPWNFPLAMGTRKIGPALAAGCTIVLKPASATPLTSLLLMEVLHEVGVPKGVVNCFVSSRSGSTVAPLIADPRLRKLTFTGSTEVGKRLLEQASQRVLRTSMELGGNAPFLVLESADLDRAVEGAVAAKMRNIGEACTAANRFLVHSSLAEEFTRRLGERIGGMTVGNGLEQASEVGPIISAEAVDDILQLVNDAVDDGATVVTGGSRIEGEGFFMKPTVLADVRTTSRVVREEIFGPVAPVMTFDTAEEAIEIANSTEFGLIAYVFGQDISEAVRVAEGLHTGMVGLNSGVISNPAAPFGGVKESGLGREGGFEGIEEYLETKYVGLSL
ncbi:MAG: NAD-dependent succinate-semialdehyde dehydrogenase [Actinobacteria bacterium]|nr:NAD-dependent succinate-semialdehyde dehydrogenase [Actinomycetota bacterium]